MSTTATETREARARRYKGYEDALHAVFTDMERHSERGDDDEAAVRIAWSRLYRSRIDSETRGIG